MRLSVCAHIFCLQLVCCFTSFTFSAFFCDRLEISCHFPYKYFCFPPCCIPDSYPSSQNTDKSVLIGFVHFQMKSETNKQIVADVLLDQQTAACFSFLIWILQSTGTWSSCSTNLCLRRAGIVHLIDKTGAPAAVEHPGVV